MKHKLAILSFAIASAASAQNLAIVNGKAIPSSRVAAMESQITASGQPITEQVKKQIREELINREIFAQEAVARGLHTTADFQQQLELARSTVLIRALILDEQAKNPIGDEQAKAEYDRITAEMNQKEYQTAHILVADEAKAKKLIAELEAGADFAVTQPVFEPEALERFLEASSGRLPLIAGIWPFMSLRNAEFLANEMPGVHVPDDTVERMRRAQASGAEAAVEEGVENEISVLKGFYCAVYGSQPRSIGTIQTLIQSD